MQIYEAIKKYYPIGINRDSFEIFFEYDGLKKLDKIITDNIYDISDFALHVKQLMSELETNLEKKIIDTTYSNAPCYSYCIEIDSTVYGNMKRIKELYIFISLVGNFYTIIGKDSNIIELTTLKEFVRATNYLVISPIEEYAYIFDLCTLKFEEKFTNFRFVPFHICKLEILGLELKYTDTGLKTVFAAIFNDQIYTNAKNIIGNPMHKCDSWLI